MFKKLVIIFTVLLISNYILSQNVGIGTDSPLDLLHLKDGQIRLDGVDTRGLIFHNNNFQNGIFLFDPSTNRFHLSNNLNNPGIIYDIPGKYMLLGRDFRIGGEVFGIRSTAPNYGGMYIETLSETAKPFYGYATNGVYKMWHYYEGGTGYWHLYNNGQDRLTVTDVGNVGIGNNAPSHTLDILSFTPRGLYLNNNFGSTASKYGAYFDVSSEGTGQKYGVYTNVIGNNNSSSPVYGARFNANGNSGTGSVYGVYANVSNLGSGNRYAIYAIANTTNPGPNSKSWALYTVGHSYFANDVRIGNLDGASGYRLTVDGKIMSEELKVQMSGAWPDYVFEENYNLMEIEEIEQFIIKNKHLPGVPSAQEILEDNGFEVGETSRILLEKIEELTLMLIKQNKQIKNLEGEIENLKNK